MTLSKISSAATPGESPAPETPCIDVMTTRRIPKRSSNGLSVTTSPIVVQFGSGAMNPFQPRRRRWCSICAEEPASAVLDLPVENGDGLDVRDVDIVFSAVESDAARELEPQYAKTTAVLSTASAFRYEDDVPILVPGVN